MKIDCSYDALVEIDEIVPNPKNPNIHSEKQINRLAKIIAFQGQRSPLVVSKSTGLLVVGHGRLEAIKELGWDKVAVNYQDFESEAQEYAHMTADNAIAEWSHIDLSNINLELQNLGPDLDVEFLGLKNFTIEPMDKLGGSPSDEKSNKLKLEVEFPNEMELMDIHDDLYNRGYKVKIRK